MFPYLAALGSDINYYERHIGDYLKDTAHLSLLEHGVYARLLDVYYTREGAIPVHDVARLVGARSKDERAALALVLDEFFEAIDGALVQHRCEREIERYQDKQRKAKASADARWANAPQHTERNADAMRTHSEGNAPRARPQTPDTRHQTPSTNPQPPTKPRKEKKTSPGVAEATPAAPTAAVWASYSSAYRSRYGVEPVRNASVNGQLAQVVGKLGADEAPGVAGFYLGHQNGLYVSSMHPVNLLLRDAEKLRTEWVTGRQVTRMNGVHADRTQTNLNVFGPMIAEARAREMDDDETKRSAT